MLIMELEHPLPVVIKHFFWIKEEDVENIFELQIFSISTDLIVGLNDYSSEIVPSNGETANCKIKIYKTKQSFNNLTTKNETSVNKRIRSHTRPYGCVIVTLNSLLYKLVLIKSMYLCAIINQN